MSDMSAESKERHETERQVIHSASQKSRASMKLNLEALVKASLPAQRADASLQS